MESEVTIMKATGIVRRIDDLGRVVIPKEIRRTMRIREGDPLEIFTDREGEVILKKYSPLHNLGQFASEYVDALYEALGVPILLSDRDEIVAVAGIPKKTYTDRRLSTFVEEIMKARRPVLHQQPIALELVVDHYEEVQSYCMAPIIANGDIIGCIYILSKDGEIGALEQKSAEIGALFLAKQMEN